MPVDSRADPAAGANCHTKLTTSRWRRPAGGAAAESATHAAAAIAIPRPCLSRMGCEEGTGDKVDSMSFAGTENPRLIDVEYARRGPLRRARRECSATGAKDQARKPSTEAANRMRGWRFLNL